ncbi:MAG: exodeoxyribonuclease VII large subunit [Rhodocyclaceae bacterium]|nr:exodeoxyribonuclease VII large subunit [Rhodocyclaceae bacterium]
MDDSPRIDPGTPVSVSALNRMARQALEQRLPLLWITGEISNLVRAASGHMYFTLKDDRAQVRCTLWRGKAQLLPFRLENGQQLEVRALPSLYEARGEFQLNVETVRRAGLGSLFEAFVRLREQLQGEGLFDPALKRPLPRYPRAIGVVTSPQAAALRDVVAALRRRAPGVPLILYPAPVQGDGAPARLAAALQRACARAEEDQIDVILLVRGGGSLEDLWAFNDEALARVIRAASRPVISGVGHESDVSISDFVADVRAATPTAAAELATQGYVELAARLDTLQRGLDAALAQRLNAAAQRLDRAALRLIHPAQRIARSRERLDGLAHRLDRGIALRLSQHKGQSEQLAWRLAARRPRLDAAAEELRQLHSRLDTAVTRTQTGRRQRLDAIGAALAHLDPHGVLARGYGIVRDAQGRIIRNPAQVPIGSAIRIALQHGSLEADVTGQVTGDTSAGEAHLSGPRNPD